MLDEKTLSDVMKRRPAKVVTIQSKNTQWHVERVIKAIFARIAFTIRLINIKDRENQSAVYVLPNLPIRLE